MLRETSAASTMAVSTATGAPAAPARRAGATKTATATAAPSARPIRKTRIPSLPRPAASSIRAQDARRKAERDHFDLRRDSSAGGHSSRGGQYFGLGEKSARGVANQGRPEKDRRFGRCVRNRPLEGDPTSPYDASLICSSSRVSFAGRTAGDPPR